MSEEKSDVFFWFTIPNCIIKDENDSSIARKGEQEFTQEEINILKPMLKELEKLEVYQITEINKVLRRIECESERIMKWTIELEKIVYEGNADLYSKFLILN